MSNINCELMFGFSVVFHVELFRAKWGTNAKKQIEMAFYLMGYKVHFFDRMLSIANSVTNEIYDIFGGDEEFKLEECVTARENFDQTYELIKMFSPEYVEPDIVVPRKVNTFEDMMNASRFRVYEDKVKEKDKENPDNTKLYVFGALGVMVVLYLNA